MTIYKLYIKTHSETGLKYLGVTSKEDVHKYPGSGKYWKAHLRQHGNNYTTEILRECQSNKEVRQWGTYYSILFNIMHARDEKGNRIWANLKLETGDGAPPGTAHHMSDPEIHARAVDTRRKNGNYRRSPEAIYKEKETKLSKYGTLNTLTPEIIQKIQETKKRNGTTGNNLTNESIAKGLATKRKNGTMNSNTTESISKGLETKKINGTMSSSPNVITKALETKLRNGTTNTSTPESIAKRVETRRRRIQEGTDGVTLRVVCPHCNKEGGQSIMKRWHFNNCKLK